MKSCPSILFHPSCSSRDHDSSSCKGAFEISEQALQLSHRPQLPPTGSMGEGSMILIPSRSSGSQNVLSRIQSTTPKQEVAGFSLVLQRNHNKLMHSQHGNTMLRLGSDHSSIFGRLQLNLFKSLFGDNHPIPYQERSSTKALQINLETCIPHITHPASFSSDHNAFSFTRQQLLSMRPQRVSDFQSPFVTTTPVQCFAHSASHPKRTGRRKQLFDTLRQFGKQGFLEAQTIQNQN